jgi:hypothetical protein
MAVKGTKNKKIESVEAQAVLTTVRGLSLPKVVAEVSDLQLSIQGQLAALSNSLANKITQVEQLDTAIGLKEQRLKELHGIESEAITLDDMRAQKEAEQVKWQADRDSRTAEWDDETQERAKRWQREEANYAYTWAQKLEREKEAFEADVARAKRNEQIRQETLAKAWSERENAIKAKETEFTALKQQVDGFDARLKAEVAKEVAVATNALKRTYDHEKALLVKDNEASQKLADMSVKSAEAKVAAMTEQIKELQAQLLAARTDAKEVATQALQSASGRQVADALQRVVDAKDTNTQGKK